MLKTAQKVKKLTEKMVDNPAYLERARKRHDEGQASEILQYALKAYDLLQNKENEEISEAVAPRRERQSQATASTRRLRRSQTTVRQHRSASRQQAVQRTPEEATALYRELFGTGHSIELPPVPRRRPTENAGPSATAATNLNALPRVPRKRKRSTPEQDTSENKRPLQRRRTEIQPRRSAQRPLERRRTLEEASALHRELFGDAETISQMGSSGVLTVNQNYMNR